MPCRYEVNKGYLDGPEDTYKLDCPYCGKNFEIRPQYDFLGYAVFADELQMEKDRRKNVIHK